MVDEIAAAVRRARERERLTLAEVATAASVSIGALHALEDGEPSVSTAEIGRIASALRLEPSELVRGREVPVLSASVFLRHATIPDFDDRDSVVLEAALAQARSLRQLTRLDGAPTYPLNRECSVAGPDPKQAAEQGYGLARALRREMGMPEQPLGDAGELLERGFCVAVLVRCLHGHRIAAVSVRSAEGAAAILNGNDGYRLRNPIVDRVHLAHELCHLLFDPSDGGVHIVIDVERDRSDQLAESRAGGFAAELLLPAKGLRELLGPPRKVESPSPAEDLVRRARRHFRTPFRIAVHHLTNLDYISDTVADWLEREARRNKLVEPTQLPVAGAPSLTLFERTRRAHDVGSLTDGEASELLQLAEGERLPW